jgi:uncharacterized protein with ParB-like and HNH nuclease domain
MLAGPAYQEKIVAPRNNEDHKREEPPNCLGTIMERVQRQSDLSIDAEPLSVEKMFGDFYAVPDFQREYVWQREHVEQLLTDICDELYDENGSIVTNAEYFIGSVVVYKDDEGIFQLIDGQQRTTTLFIILCALHERLNELDTLKSLILHKKMNSQRTGEESRYRVQLLYEDAMDALQRIATHDNARLDSIQQTNSVKNMRAAYIGAKEFFYERLGDNSSDWSRFFFEFTTRVKLIRVITPSQTGALRVFETINNTGVGLTPMDLLKNLLFRKVKPAEFQRVTKEWKELTDEVAQAGEKNPLRFLRYFVLSRYDTKTAKPLPEDALYRWLSDNAKIVGIEENALAFLKRLLADAKVYRQFSQAKDARGLDNRYLQNIQILSGRAKQHSILLLAGQRLESALFERLCQVLENLFFTFIITKEATKAFEAVFFKAAEPLRNLHPADLRGLEDFIAKWLQPAIDARAAKLKYTLETMRIGSVQKYRLRYILAKLTQFVDEEAWGSSMNTDLRKYLDKQVHLEHVLPETPASDSISQFDKPEEYANYADRLGNLTLLERSINTSIQQNFFASKAVEYQKSIFMLTRTIGAPFKMGSNTQPNRAAAKLPSWQDWNSRSIEERQVVLVKLAWKAWGIAAIGGVTEKF